MTSHSIGALEIPGGWHERSVTVGEFQFSLLAPANPDEFVNQLAEADESTLPRMRSDPYWAQLWTAALPFASAVARADWPVGTTILELGCGIGLPGLVACQRGWSTTFSDYVEEAVSLALENARRHGFHSPQAEGLVLDWRDPPARSYDRLIASDVIYEERLHRPFLKAASALLAAHGEVWVADPGRSMCDDFLGLARKKGWQVALFAADDSPVAAPELGQFRRIVLRRDEPTKESVIHHG